ncbi:glutamate-5-semialdehyde dehydrogenase [Candidatus Nomurabacteria bacterium]|nr:glutamate-5-semialdehyde dehydrogenase [Candidatus Nomurabacteria bacterium]
MDNIVNTSSSVEQQAMNAKKASMVLRQASIEQKNKFLMALAATLEENEEEILKENTKDLEAAKNITSAMKRRLNLTKEIIMGMAKSVREIAEAKDPVGKVVTEVIRPNGLDIVRVRVPIGVIAVIFESRPNVIIDVAALCVKSGNAVIVRGGKEAMLSNNALAICILKALEQSGLPVYTVQQLEDKRHEAIGELVQLEDYLDLVIPRGREELIRMVSEKSKVAVIKHVRGLCHLYIDSEADAKKAIRIAVNAKTSNPSTCNSIETLLIHKDIAGKVMPELLKKLFEKNVEVRGDKNVCKYDLRCVVANEEDWSTEYLDLILSIKMVDSYEDAVAHIQKYSSGLTDAIITENKSRAEDFLKVIDSATVLVNASNRLTDGGVFGLGAEIGISTSRIHMRGPMGLEDLTVTRYNVLGTGQIRE